MSINLDNTNLLSLIGTYDGKSILGNEISSFEKEASVSLPPIFKSFIENFDVWSISEFALFQVKNLNSNTYSNIDIGNFKYDDEIGIELMLKPSEYIHTKENIYHYEEDEEIVKGKTVIGNIYGGCLLIGHEESNKDFIYADKISEDVENRCIKIAENILEYFRNIIYKPDPIILDRLNINLEELCRCWNDKHWHIKKEERKSR